MKIQTFRDVQENVRDALASRPVQEQEEEQEVGEVTEQYPNVGDRWQGPIYGAPYANPKLEAHNFYRMPGRRKQVKDILAMLWEEKMGYYKRFLASGIFGFSAAVALWALPIPFSVIAVPFAGLAFLNWNHGWLQKKGDFGVMKRFGMIRNVMTDKETYPVYNPPFRITRKWIWK